jgi:hypothetical protein
MNDTDIITIPIHKQDTQNYNDPNCIYPKNLQRKDQITSTNTNEKSNKKNISRYHKQLFSKDSTISYQFVPCTMFIKNNSDDLLRINLTSPIFCSDFDKKVISKVTTKSNLNGSIDLFIYFKK